MIPDSFNAKSARQFSSTCLLAGLLEAAFSSVVLNDKERVRSKICRQIFMFFDPMLLDKNDITNFYPLRLKKLNDTSQHKVFIFFDDLDLADLR